MEPGAKVKWEDGLQGLLTFGYDLVIRFDDFKRQREKRPQSKKKICLAPQFWFIANKQCTKIDIYLNIWHFQNAETFQNQLIESEARGRNGPVRTLYHGTNLH